MVYRKQTVILMLIGTFGVGCLANTVLAQGGQGDTPTGTTGNQPVSVLDERLPFPPAISPQLARTLAEEAIVEALNEPSSADFEKVTLQDAVNTLKAKHKIEILIDVAALKDEGLDAATMVTCKIENARLATIIRLILDQLSLTWTIDNEVLLITTSERSETLLLNRVYPVSDLAVGRDALGQAVEDYDELTEVIENILLPTSWEDVGGIGTISSIRGNLVVEHTPQVHLLMPPFLSALRKARKQQLAVKTEDRYIPLGINPGAYDGKLAAVLRAKTELDIVAKPLAEALHTISQTHDIEIQIDLAALESDGVAIDTPVSIKLTSVSLRSALNLLLRSVELTWIASDELIYVTTPEAAAARPTIRVYPVRDLVAIDDTVSDEDTFDFDSLVDAVMQSVSPDSWSDAGGIGVIIPFRYANSLVCLQTRKNHENLEQMLSALRRAEKNLTTEQRSHRAKLRAAPKLKSYSFVLGIGGPTASKAPEEVIKLIRDLIDPDSWEDSADGVAFIRKTDGGILVRHNSKVHLRIRSLLEELGYSQKGIGGFGGGLGAGGGGFF